MQLWEPVNGVFMATATTPFLANIAWLEKWAEMPLIAAVVGGTIGAGFGAWAAGRIANRNKRHDSVTDEIRTCSLAMLLAQQVFNLTLALKIDAVKPMSDAYNKARAEYLDPKIGAVSATRSLQTISPINAPLDALRTVALERLTLPGAAIRVVLRVVDSVDCLNHVLTTRNELTDKFLHQQFPPGMDSECMYFGVTKDGSCHAGYRDSMRGMARRTDEALFFSMTLCQMLEEHGVQLRKEYKKLTRAKASISRFSLAPNIPEGIIPDAKDYANWLAGYEVQANTKKWWPWGKK